jgi:hypothetical protein
LIDFQGGGLRHIGSELRGEFCHVVGKECGLVASAGDGDIREARVEQIWVVTRSDCASRDNDGIPSPR